MIGDGDIAADLVGRHVGADVDIGELADAEAVEGAGEFREANGRGGGLEPVSGSGNRPKLTKK